MLEDEVFKAFTKVEGASLIGKYLRLYILFCYKNEYIDEQDLLYLYSYLQVGGNGEDVSYILFDSDARRTTGMVVDLRNTIHKMNRHITEFDWDGVTEYIIVRN